MNTCIHTFYSTTEHLKTPWSPCMLLQSQRLFEYALGVREAEITIPQRVDYQIVFHHYFRFIPPVSRSLSSLLSSLTFISLPTEKVLTETD